MSDAFFRIIGSGSKGYDIHILEKTKKSHSLIVNDSCFKIKSDFKQYKKSPSIQFLVLPP